MRCAHVAFFVVLPWSLGATGADVILGSGFTVAPGESIPFSVSLQNVAPPGGVTIAFTSSDTNKVTVSPASIYVPGGYTTPFGLPRATGGAFGTATITASAQGLIGSSESVNVAAVLSAPVSQPIPQGTTVNVTFSLPWPVPSPITLAVRSDDTGVATAPPAVVIAAGTAVAVAPITGVAAGNTTIRVGAPPYVPETAVAIGVFRAGSITLSPLSLTLGQSRPLPVTLGTPAPPGGVTIMLGSSDPQTVAVAPTSIFIPAGQTAPATYPEVGGINIGAATITASAPGYTNASSQIPVTATITMSPATLRMPVGGTQTLAMILSAAAPSIGVPITPDRAAGGFVSGLTVQLSSSDPRVAAVQPTVQFYPDGSSITTVVVIISGVSTGTAVIHAGAPPFIPDVTAAVTVGSPVAAPASLTVVGGNLQSAQVSTPFGLPLSVMALDSSSNPVSGVLISFSPPFTGPGGAFLSGLNTAVTDATGVARSQTFTANGAAGTYQVMATAAAVAAPATFTLTNTAAASGTIALPAGVAVSPHQSVPFPIALTAAAPPGGVNVTLGSSDVSTATVAPAALFIPQGATSPAVQPAVTGVNFGSASIGATAGGYASASQLVQVGATLSFAPAALTINGSGTQNVVLSLSSPAPAAGLAITLSSSNPAAATVPGSIAFAPNSTAVNVPITAAGPGSATITAIAGAPNVPNATTSVVVSAPSSISIAAGIQLAAGQSAALPVTLTSPAGPMGVTIALASTDTSRVTISPANLYIYPGSTAPFAAPQISGANLGTADIRASAYGLTDTSQTVRVVGKLFGPPAQTIARASTANLMFALSWTPATALTLSVTSDNAGVASAPASVTIPAGATTAIVPVSGIAAGTAVVHVSALPDVQESTVSITVQAPGVISMASGVVVPLGESATLAVTLGAPAPSGGLVLTLTSSDPSTVSISPGSVFFAPGSTAPAAAPVVTGNNIGQANITASAPGYLSATQAVSVSATISISPATLVIPSGSTRLLALALSAAAPSVNTPITPDRGAGGFVNGLTVQLSSSNSQVATLQPTVQFYPDGSSITTVVVSVTGVAPGTAIIRAAAPPYIPAATATVIVQ
jgi:hypothetical protein